MLLRESLQASGHVLFRRRGYALLLLLPLVALAIGRGEQLEEWMDPGWNDDGFEAMCFALAFCGLLMRALTVGFVPRRTSGRNTGGQVADALNTTGLYSLTRNPLYLANCVTYLAIVMTTQDSLLVVAVALFLGRYYERIMMAEETFLLGRFGAAYRDWAARVPPFLPRLHGWQRPALPFSLRTVLRREPSSWLAAVVGIGVIDIAGDAAEGEWTAILHDGHLTAMATALAIYLLLNALKRFTAVLRVPGR